MGETQARSRRGHFSEEDWLDFARDQAAGAKAGMQQHLAAGCHPCAATLRFWRSALAVAARGAAVDGPPESAVRQARASFQSVRPKGLVARAAEAAALAFDSFRQPLPAGVRTTGASPRQTLYQAGPYVLRLRVEPGPASDRLSVVGQVVDDADPTRAMKDLAVLVFNGTHPVDRTLTNDLGEFELEPEPADNLRLSVAVPGRGPLTVPVLVRRRGQDTVPRELAGPGRKTNKRRQSKTTTPRR
jgi:hypothetical protein